MVNRSDSYRVCDSESRKHSGRNRRNNSFIAANCLAPNKRTNPADLSNPHQPCLQKYRKAANCF